MMAVKPGLDLLDTADIHDCGAMYPQELSRVELLFKAGEGLAEFVLASADVKAYVVAISFDPIDVLGRDKLHSSVCRSRQPVRIGLDCGKSVQAGYDAVQLVMLELASNSPLGASDSPLKPIFPDRFQQIVNAVHFKSIQCKFIERGCEDNWFVYP